MMYYSCSFWSWPGKAWKKSFLLCFLAVTVFISSNMEVFTGKKEPKKYSKISTPDCFYPLNWQTALVFPILQFGWIQAPSVWIQWTSSRLTITIAVILLLYCHFYCIFKEIGRINRFKSPWEIYRKSNCKKFGQKIRISFQYWGKLNTWQFSID